MSKKKENIKNFVTQSKQAELIMDLSLKIIKDKKFIKKHNITSIKQIHDQLIIEKGERNE